MLSKIEKAVAKLYYALGESGGAKLAGVENPAFLVEYLASIAIRDTGKALGLKYFGLGASSALRAAKKPQGGKSKSAGKSAAAKPPKGKKAPVSRTVKRLPPKGKKHGEEDDFDDDDDDFSEGDW